MILIHQRHRQTDRRTDGQHAISIPRYALVHRAVIRTIRRRVVHPSLFHIPHSFIMFGSRCWIYKHCYIKFKIKQNTQIAGLAMAGLAFSVARANHCKRHYLLRWNEYRYYTEMRQQLQCCNSTTIRPPTFWLSLDRLSFICRNMAWQTVRFFYT